MWKLIRKFINKIISFVVVHVRSSTIYLYLQNPIIRFFVLYLVFVYCYFCLGSKLFLVYGSSFYTFFVDNFYSKEELIKLDKQNLLFLVNYLVDSMYTLNNLREFDLYSLNNQVVDVIYTNHPKDYTNKPWRKATYTDNFLLYAWFREALHEVDPSVAITLDRRIEVNIKRSVEESKKVWEEVNILWEDYRKKHLLEKDMTKLWEEFLKTQSDKQNRK